MTLEEAIKHAEEVMVENLEATKNRNASDPIAIICFECAENHRQLAEWLKDYKRLKEQESKTGHWIPVSERFPENNTKVLVTLDATYKEKVLVTWYQDREHGFLCGLVKAWMPLPEPYKEESEGI